MLSKLIVRWTLWCKSHKLGSDQITHKFLCSRLAYLIWVDKNMMQSSEVGWQKEDNLIQGNKNNMKYSPKSLSPFPPINNDCLLQGNTYFMRVWYLCYYTWLCLYNSCTCLDNLQVLLTQPHDVLWYYSLYLWDILSR